MVRRERFASGVTGLQIAESISPRLAKESIAAKVDGVVRDLSYPVATDAAVELLTFDKPQGKQVFWHSSSHIMAQAVQELFPRCEARDRSADRRRLVLRFRGRTAVLAGRPGPHREADGGDCGRGCPVPVRGQERFESVDYYKAKGAIYKVELLEGSKMTPSPSITTADSRISVVALTYRGQES